jgi:hypothetical protein
MAARRTLVVAVALGLWPMVAWAGGVPETVSPGMIGGLARIGGACPTFSWGTVGDSQEYELVVYALGSDADEWSPALMVRIPGAASSWTPSLEDCLAPGRRYVWFVRAVGPAGAGEWSEGRMFEVVEGQVIREVEQALAALKELTGEADDEVPEATSGGEESRDTEAIALSVAEKADFPAAPGTGVEIAESSITIGGVEVVTAATDRDTLGGMSCADGQLAKWNSGLSEWECGDDGGGSSYLAGNQLTLNGSTFHVVEGPGSGLDADMLDGAHASGFLAAGTDNWVDTTGDTMTGKLETADVDLGGVVEKDGATLLWADNSDNTALGKRALSTSTIGRRSTAIGAGALENEEGLAFYYSMNTAVGAEAMRDTTTGFYNTAVGADALRSNTEGYSNTALGKEALLLSTTGYSNSAVGAFSMFHNSDGSKNTAIGEAALWGNTTGDSNTAAGQRALFSNAAGLRNSAFGARSLEANQGDNPGTPGLAEGSDNSALGFEALFSNTTGLQNTAMGTGAMRTNTFGSLNTALGSGALYDGNGSSNTAVGAGSLGGSLGSSNIGIGKDAGSSLGAGSFNIMIGNAGDVADDHTIRLGDSNSWETYIAGIRGSTLVGGSPLPVAVDSQGRLGTAAFGSSSGLDADLLDGLSSGAFLRSDASDAFTAGTLTFNAGTSLDIDGSLVATGALAVHLPANKIYGAGSGSGLDADKLDGKEATDFATSSHLHDAQYVNQSGDTMTGLLTVPSLTVTAATATTRLNTTGTTSDLRIQQGGSNRWSLGWNSGSKYLYFYDWAAPGGTRLVIEDDTGHVGVGATNPEALLDVQGPGTTAGGVPNYDEVMARFRQTATIGKHSAVSIDSADFGLTASPGQDPILYFSSGGEAAWDIRVDDSDYDLGWVTPPVGGYYICYPGWRDSLEIRYQVDGENFTGFQLRPRHYFHPDCQSLPDFAGVDLWMNGHILPAVDDNYSLGHGALRWTSVYATNPLISTSDKRLKDEIAPIGYGLGEVLALRPVSFEWRNSNDSRTYLGLIAQEVEPLIPEVVHRGRGSGDAWAMTYASLTPVLIKAIQEQQEIIEGLRDRIEALEASR